MDPVTLSRTLARKGAGDVPAAPPAPDAVLRRIRATAVTLLGALIVMGLAWELWLAPTGARTWAVKVLPLALALPGLWHLRMFTHRWLALLVWLYVGEGLVRGVSDRGPGQSLAWMQVALAVALFFACVSHVRWRLRRARRSAR